MKIKSLFAAVAAVMALTAPVHATEFGGNIGTKIGGADYEGVKVDGLGIEGAISTKYDNGVIAQFETGRTMFDTMGASTKVDSYIGHLGYSIKPNMTAGLYAGRVNGEIAGLKGDADIWGLEGKYTHGRMDFETSYGVGTADLGLADLDFKQARFGTRYGTDVANLGNVGLGFDVNWIGDDSSSISANAKSYRGKVDLLTKENLELSAAVGYIESDLRGLKTDGQFVEFGAKYHFGSGAHFRGFAF